MPASRLRFAALLAVVALLAAPSVGEAEPRASKPSCVTVRGEARYRNYGYDHVVHVLNGCARTASCDVSTDVNPTAQRVSVGSKQGVEVVTFVGSPAREFVPNVTCELR